MIYGSKQINVHIFTRINRKILYWVELRSVGEWTLLFRYCSVKKHENIRYSKLSLSMKNLDDLLIIIFIIKKSMICTYYVQVFTYMKSNNHTRYMLKKRELSGIYYVIHIHFAIWIQ